MFNEGVSFAQCSKMAQTLCNKTRQFENWQHVKVQVRLTTRLELVKKPSQVEGEKFPPK